MNDFLKNIDTNLIKRIIASIVVVILAIIIYKTIVLIFTKQEEKFTNDKEAKRKRNTFLKLFRSILRYILVAITALIIMEINGVDVGSLFAGIGIAGAIIGLAVQDALKDIIRGSTLITDGYFSVGDIIKYNNIEGQVMVLGLKTTKVRDLATGNIISIANRNIEQVEVESTKMFINIPLPYELTLKDAESVILDIIESIKSQENVLGCKYLSVNELADSSINYLIEVDCNPTMKLQIRRNTLHQILEIAEKNHISIPYQQIDVHVDNVK